MRRSEHEEIFDHVYEYDLRWREERERFPRPCSLRPIPYPRRRFPVPPRFSHRPAGVVHMARAPRPAGGVSVRGLLFLLGFIGTGFLIVTLYPYRMLILHLVIGLLVLLVLVVWLVVALKVRKRMHSRRAYRHEERSQHPASMPRVHDASPGEYPVRRYAEPSLPAFADFLYTSDDRTNKRPSEHLEPDQRSRF